MARLLLDENMPPALAAELAAAGHDAVSIAARDPGLNDLGVLAKARREERILLTFDAVR